MCSELGLRYPVHEIDPITESIRQLGTEGVISPTETDNRKANRSILEELARPNQILDALPILETAGIADDEVGACRSSPGQEQVEVDAVADDAYSFG
jgi:hypothetical protein